MATLLIYFVPMVTFLINPWNSYDGINVPKLSMLVVSAAILAALLVLDLRLVIESRYRATVIFSGLFKIALWVSLLAHPNPFNEHFFGTYGRNTGFLAYLSLLIIFFVAVVSLDKKTSEKLVWSLLSIGGLSIIYGLFQSFKLDPFKWNNPYSPVLGFLGNPDFQSSLLGICGVAAVALFFSPKASLKFRTGLGLYLLLTGYVIARTKAQQGFLVFLAGSAIVLFVLLHKTQSTQKLSFIYLPLLLASGVLVVMGSLNKGPLAHALYKASVTYRGDYWRAAWKMTTSHPFTGVGLDSYGNWYRQTRDLAATLRRGPEIASNAAHNVFLDMSSNGGFPLLIAYLLIVGYALFSAIKVIRRSAGFDPVLSALFGAWFAYQLQSSISINQIGLAVWGWALSGALIAYEISTREVAESVKAPITKGRMGKSRSQERAISATSVIAICLGAVVGLALALPPYLADAGLRSALRSGFTTNLEIAVKKWPLDETRLFYGAQLLYTSKLQAKALAMSEFTANRDPRFYYAWKEISANSAATPAQKSEALAHMKALDPHNPNLK